MYSTMFCVQSPGRGRRRELIAAQPEEEEEEEPIASSSAISLEGADEKKLSRKEMKKLKRKVIVCVIELFFITAFHRRS